MEAHLSDAEMREPVVPKVNLWTCKVGGGAYKLHDWRLIDERHAFGEETLGLVRRRWYCTRCRTVESVVSEDG